MDSEYADLTYPKINRLTDFLPLQLAELRDREGLTQTQHAARAGMPSSKISAVENAPQNLEVETLVRIARGANRKLKISFVR